MKPASDEAQGRKVGDGQRHTNSDERPLIYTPEEALAISEMDFERYCRIATLSFSLELKRAALVELEHEVAELTMAVVAARQADDGELASRWHAVQTFIESQVLELRMWVALNDKSFEAAYGYFVSAQKYAAAAERWLGEFPPVAALVERLAHQETVLFPRQWFFSLAFIVDENKVECSICRTLASSCDHIPGRLYNGFEAQRILGRVVSVREISMVDNPSDKRCRVIDFGGIDPLTGKDRENTDTVNDIV